MHITCGIVLAHSYLFLLVSKIITVMHCIQVRLSSTVFSRYSHCAQSQNSAMHLQSYTAADGCIAVYNKLRGKIFQTCTLPDILVVYKTSK